MWQFSPFTSFKALSDSTQPQVHMTQNLKIWKGNYVLLSEHTADKWFLPVLLTAIQFISIHFKTLYMCLNNRLPKCAKPKAVWGMFISSVSHRNNLDLKKKTCICNLCLADVHMMYLLIWNRRSSRMARDFMSFSTVFQSYQDDGRAILKGCMHGTMFMFQMILISSRDPATSLWTYPNLEPIYFTNAAVSCNKWYLPIHAIHFYTHYRTDEPWVLSICVTIPFFIFRSGIVTIFCQIKLFHILWQWLHKNGW